MTRKWRVLPHLTALLTCASGQHGDVQNSAVVSVGDMVSFLPHGDIPVETDEALDMLRKGVTMWHGRITQLWVGDDVKKVQQSDEWLLSVFAQRLLAGSGPSGMVLHRRRYFRYEKKHKPKQKMVEAQPQMQ